MTRGFEIVNKYKNEDGSTYIELPTRKTAKSAGYDIRAAKEVFLYPKQMVVVPTGIKAFMGDDEFLDLRIRSGLAIKNQIILLNGCGVIDADYYNNEDNEGEILVGLMNVGNHPLNIRQGERIAQGLFCTFLKTDNDEAEGKRVGGLGSTGTTDKPVVNKPDNPPVVVTKDGEELPEEVQVIAKAFAEAKLAEAGIPIVTEEQEITVDPKNDVKPKRGRRGGKQE
jgi:dUTP pyrophosphatase